MQDAYGFFDHYEALQLSPNADAETVDRVYRFLAKRYHPDNHHTGDVDRFKTIAEAHRVLSDPEQRAAYDVKYEEHRGASLKMLEEASDTDSFAGDRRTFDAILSLLYISRRREPRQGGMGILQLEKMLGSRTEHLEFHTWYLLQKELIERMDNGQYSITANGVDFLTSQDSLTLRRDRLLAERTSPNRETFESEHDLLTT